MRALLSALAAAALVSCGPEFEEPGAAAAQPLTEQPIPDVPTGRTPAGKIEQVTHPDEVKADPGFRTFDEAYAYTVCALGYCR